MTTAVPMMARIGIDVGGTFTDLVAAVPERGLVVHHKEPSTPADPSRAVADGLAVILAQADLRPEEIGGITHGTTIGLNAIIQRRGARIALVVTEGYRDILEIGRSRMPSSFDLYAGKEEPLVPRDRIVEISARLGPGGVPVSSPDAAELDRVAARLRAIGADAAAVLVLHGYTDPAFEEGVAAGLRERLPELPLMASATVWPEVREYERALVACLNAYIQPLMRDYFGRLESRVRALGVPAPIFISASNGGSMSLRSAAERPIETVLSGPAAGVAAAARLGMGAIVTFDMGGTSSDIAVTVNGSPELATHTTVGGLPLIVPVVAVSAIGAGGGSVVWVDGQGVLKVGPESVGAEPGPVAYGRGGDRPAVTDCYLVTGMIDPATFLGGRMRLDADAAAKSLTDIATRLSGRVDSRPHPDSRLYTHPDSHLHVRPDSRLSAGAGPWPGAVAGPDAGFPVEDGAVGAAHRAAAGALRVATAGMATELQKIMAQRGLDPRRFTLVPFGGAGPTHAAMLAEEVGITHIVVPPTAATFCALGAAGADLRRDFARSLRRRLDPASAARLSGVLAELSDQAQAWLTEQSAAAATGNGAGASEARLSHSADMRYAGQAYELRVALDPARLEVEAISEAFHAEHERLYGFRDQHAPIELGTARLGVVGPVAELPSATVPPGTGTPAPHGRRQVLLAGAWHAADVHLRSALGVGDAFDGPAIVEQDDTTVVVPPGWSGSVDGTGNLHLRRSRKG
ncbi:hydantoinase/oxoprolinase family protein [Nonomuraea sp. NPDC026600]|uniref:hydantoinase/oxoprolinase family protein n=1 Tax=Nonomuraea sp. NPDC026600 TaxID=3155363 RepID=UPI0033E46E8E